MRRSLLALGMALVCIACVSCATKTELSGVWKADSAEARPMEQILVIGIAENDINRRSFEDGFAAALNEQGATRYPATASCRIQSGFRRNRSSGRFAGVESRE